MKVLDIRDKEDGSCEIDCEFTEREVKILLNFVVNEMIRNYLEGEENVKMD